MPAFRYAFSASLPVLTGYLSLGIAYGIYARAEGVSVWLPTLMALVIYGGSLEFVTITMLLSPFAPVQAFAMALVIQARHLFYGISMLKKYKGAGWKKAFLIYWLSDETFAVAFSVHPPSPIDKYWVYFFISMLDYIYWASGATLGSIAGSILPAVPDGLSFIMTAMFLVIFLDQWLKEKKHYTALIGILCAVFCRFLFSSNTFMLPSMGLILVLLSAFRKPIEKEGGFAS